MRVIALGATVVVLPPPKQSPLPLGIKAEDYKLGNITIKNALPPNTKRHTYEFREYTVYQDGEDIGEICISPCGYDYKAMKDHDISEVSLNEHGGLVIADIGKLPKHYRSFTDEEILEHAKKLTDIRNRMGIKKNLMQKVKKQVEELMKQNKSFNINFTS